MLIFGPMKRKNIDVYELIKSNISLDCLVDDAKNFDASGGKSYILSYPEFVHYFKMLNKISKHNIVIGAHFAYGWMPTIFDFRSNKFEEVIDILNIAKNGDDLNVSQLNTLKQCFNNSLVGTSKILHFINPEKFAIWDSKICRYVLQTKTKSNPHISKPEYYLAYLRFCKYITELNGFNEVHNILISKMGYEMTRFRTVELAMFGSENPMKDVE